jgi:uncharacterized protein YbjT (DUF2867 family)
VNGHPTPERFPRILVLGASGRCGQWVVRLAAERGYEVSSALRPGSPHEPPPGVTTQRGEVLDPGFLAGLVRGHDVVVSCLGQRRAGASPWSERLSPPDLVSTVIAGTTAAMTAHGVRRLLVVSAGGAGASRAQATRPIRWMIRRGSLRTAYADLERMERHLEATDLDWLVVRPVTLVGGDPTGSARPVARYGLFSTVRRSDVADWIVRQLAVPAWAPQRRVLLGID